MDPLIPSTPPTEPVPAASSAPMPPRRKTPAVAIVVAAIALVAGIVLGAVLFGDDDEAAVGPTTSAAPSTTGGGSSTTETPGVTQPSGGAIAPPTTIDTDGLDGDALALAEAINRAYGLRYHAAFEGQLQAGAAGTRDVRLEVWRDPEAFARRDTIVTGESGLNTREIRRVEGLYGCLSPNLERWVCTRGSGSVDPADPVFGAIDPHVGIVVDAPAEAGAARCFNYLAPDGDRLVCFDDVGIPLIIDTDSGRLTRALVDEAVAATDFDLPAEPTGEIDETTSTTS